MGKQFLGEFEELVLLAIMKLGKTAYGVTIADAIEDATGKRVSIGALYTTLARLEEKNFISSWMGEKTEERGGRPKKYFAVEMAGKDAIQSSLRGRQELAKGLTEVFS
jgi:PadR family transcriptional regulator, regulatory protein PadR